MLTPLVPRGGAITPALTQVPASPVLSLVCFSSAPPPAGPRPLSPSQPPASVFLVRHCSRSIMSDIHEGADEVAGGGRQAVPEKKKEVKRGGGLSAPEDKKEGLATQVSSCRRQCSLRVRDGPMPELAHVRYGHTHVGQYVRYSPTWACPPRSSRLWYGMSAMVLCMYYGMAAMLLRRCSSMPALTSRTAPAGAGAEEARYPPLCADAR